VVGRAGPVVVWLVLGAGLASLTSRVRDWFVMTDELLYERLALSVVRLHSPLPRVHGELVANVNQLYPLLLAPVIAVKPGPDLSALHAFNAFVMASAAVPAGLLARRLTGSAALACLASVMTVVVPWIALSSFLLTEVVAYPVFVWALLAFHSAVMRPSARNDALAILAIVVAVGARAQFIVLAAVLPVAIAVHRQVRRHPGLVVVYAVGLLAVLVLVVTGHSPLGTYADTTRGNLIPPGFPSALLTHTAAIGLGLGLLPFILGGAWLIANARRDVFATLAVAAIVLVTAEVASYDIRFGGGLVRERYLFYIAPLFAIAFAAALQAGVRWWWLVAPTAVLAAGFALDPLPVFSKLNVDTPASIFDNYIRTQIGDLTEARLFLVCAALVACLMLIEGQVFLRRQWFIGAVVVVALFTTTASTAYAFARLFRVDGTAGRPVTSDPRHDQAWVDRAVGRGASVTAVPFPTITGDYWSSAAYWWDLQFWNESVDAVAGIPGQFEWTPSTFPKLALRFDRLGRASSSRAGYVIQAVGDTRFHLAGVVVINNRNVFLVRPELPWRADWSASGLYNDGWTRPDMAARISVYPYPGQAGPVERRLTVSVFAPAGVASRPFSLGKTTNVAGPNEVSQDVTVCVPMDRPAQVTLRVRGSSPVPADTSTLVTFAQPRRGGVDVSRIYLSGAVVLGC
jgi:hypothetical protein